jgi:hypothetical protein
MSKERRLAPPTMIAGPTREAGEPAVPDLRIDPRAVRVGVAASSRLEGDPAITLSPAPDPATRLPQDGVAGPDLPLINGVATAVSLERFGDVRARLIEPAAVGSTGPAVRTNLLLGPVRIDRAHGTRLREVVVDGWRIDVELEFEAVPSSASGRAAVPARPRGVGPSRSGRSSPVASWPSWWLRVTASRPANRSSSSRR